MSSSYRILFVPHTFSALLCSETRGRLRSVSNSDSEGRCYAIANCLTRKISVQPPTLHSFLAPSSSKVTPQPTISSNSEITGPPRLVRSRAVRRDIVQDWNFDEVVSA
ncbi:hypothetical protein P8452_10050 [Trifolium repens]|nr:hypothetical protein P8452_10050 [Trifolium repens]